MHISRVAYLYQGEKINAHRLIQIKVGRGPETNFFLGWPYLHICYMYIYYNFKKRELHHKIYYQCRFPGQLPPFKSSQFIICSSERLIK